MNYSVFAATAALAIGLAGATAQAQAPASSTTPPSMGQPRQTEGMGTQGMTSPANPGAANRGMANPGLANPGLANPGLANSGLANQGIAGAPSATTGNPADHNAAIATSSASPATPAHGSNSFTVGEARNRLQAKGYTNIADLKKDSNGVWRGQAQKDGNKTSVWLDYRGDVGQQ